MSEDSRDELINANDDFSSLFLAFLLLVFSGDEKATHIAEQLNKKYRNKESEDDEK